jgi:integrase
MKRLPFTVRPFKSAARPHFKWVVRGKENGKPAKKFFPSHTDAKTYAHLRNTETLQYGTELAVPSWLRVMAQRCQEKLAPFPRKTIEDATDHYIAWLHERVSSCTIKRLFDEVGELKRQTGRDPKYCRGFPIVGSELTAAYPDKLVADLTTADIDDFLTEIAARRSYAAQSRNYRRQLITTALEHAKKRGYCSQNAAKNSEAAKKVQSPVGILRPNEFAKLLAAASPKILPAIAIQGFAGLRHSEVMKLDWREIDFDGGFIEVTAKNAKSAKRRVVKIRPCLLAWLNPFAKRSGPVVACTDGLGGYHGFRIAAAKAAGVSKWPQNALRHSFASYHLAHFKDAHALALEMGHSTTDLIFSHYRAVVREAAAADYWQIAPFSRPETANVFSFTAEAYPWACRVRTVNDGSGINGEWYEAMFHAEVGGRPTRKRFANKSVALAYACDQNQKRLVRELCLEQLTNVVDFQTEKPIAIAADELRVGQAN